MSLVAYDTSDESEEEKTSKPILLKNVVNANIKKQRDTVKITIPSLKEFEENETSAVEKNPKKPKLQTGSGLFSLLPPPKNATILSKSGFVPHILSSKKEQLLTTKENQENCTNTKTISTLSVMSEEQESDDEIPSTKGKESLNVSSSKDFFWLNDLDCNNKNGETDIVSTPVKNSTFLQNLSSQLPSPSTSSIQQFYQNESNAHFQQDQELLEAAAFQTDKNSEQCISSEQQSENYSVIESVHEQLDPRESLLKDKEFLKLGGHRREFENIDIIDVKADDQLTDRKEWLMKNLTEESTHRPSVKKHNMPTQQQKRKHQITYLAFQAKEREMDLKNQWALNSRTRRETQAKYGF